MTAVIERVVVVDEGLYVGNGLVHRWLKGVQNTLYHQIVHHAPVRTGDLVAGIIPEFIQHELSLRILSATVASTAPHTRFVIDGTAENGVGYIYRNAVAATIHEETGEFPKLKGLWMKLSDGAGQFEYRVHGQRANNFMLEGYNATARRHRALHPMFPGFIT